MTSSILCCPYKKILGFHPVHTSDRNEDTRKIYDTGNGNKKATEREAYEYLLKRDFPDIKFEDGQQEEVLFSPPFCIDGYLRDKNTLRMKDEPTEGEIFEVQLLVMFKENFGSQRRNLTILSDWNRTWSQVQHNYGKAPGDQHDFIMLDGDNKLIVLIEAKCTIDSQLFKAFQQLENQLKYFREIHGHVLTSDWQAVCIIASKNAPERNEPCSLCRGFILTLDENFNFNVWWTNLLSHLNNRKITGVKVDCYKKLVGRTIGLSLTCPKFLGSLERYHQATKELHTLHPDPISAALPQEDKQFKWSKELVPVVPGYKKIILTQEQKDIFYSTEKSLIIKGDFGTGKSLMLVLKAIEMAKAGENVAFVVGNLKNDMNSQPTFFYSRVKEELKQWYTIEKNLLEGSKNVLKNLKEIEVYNGYDLSEEQFLSLSKTHHIFWDESNSRKTYENIVKHLKTRDLMVWFSTHPISLNDNPDDNQFKFVFFKIKNDNVREENCNLSENEDTTKNNAAKTMEQWKLEDNIAIKTLGLCLRNSQAIQMFADNFVKELSLWGDKKESRKSTNLKTKGIYWFQKRMKKNFVEALRNEIKDQASIVYTNIGDHPRLILCRDGIKEAVKSALNEYKTLVFIINNGSDETRVDSDKEMFQGWKKIEWQNYVREPSSYAKEKCFIMSSLLFEEFSGIEVKNVVIISLLNNYFLNDNLNELMRAVTHLTIIMQLPPEIDEQIEEAKEFCRKMKHFAKVEVLH